MALTKSNLRFLLADKTTNMSKNLLRNNLTKTYRKAPPRLEKAINLEAKEIVKISTCTIV